ncbi:hypothetical protein ASPNIDRAFT_125717 [Aspergillus niger ATCC 1015]|uniref:Caleosin domain protein n=1 Tax=Aspergillus niger (strain ATCC 1015 / CBS 113.46 / FGSC A1144 / LSHB Ac4 / NCTC 3858a / NRRL 328 / USDA 3528.7) TaxID=380704 RepID=G3Y507_ASPNA|nr:hypothetical protein ASPNIDRAFT_125717 [Aspergillus niger ATCC 1015]
MPRKVSFSETQLPNFDKPIRPPSISVDFSTTAPECPVTAAREPARYTNDYIEKPGVPRANTTASIDRPDGDESYTKQFSDFTPLQQHVLFWDRDRDGQIYPWDTYIGFRELGFNMLFSFLAVLIINLNFSYPTRLAHSFLPDPWFRVYVDAVHKAKWGAAIFEWGTTWLLIEKDGKVWKEDVRGVYDVCLCLYFALIGVRIVANDDDRVHCFGRSAKRTIPDGGGRRGSDRGCGSNGR